jgi:hypothetical protein
MAEFLVRVSEKRLAMTRNVGRKPRVAQLGTGFQRFPGSQVVQQFWCQPRAVVRILLD